MKTIDTLVADMKRVLTTGEGYTMMKSETGFQVTLLSRLTVNSEAAKGYLNLDFVCLDWELLVTDAFGTQSIGQVTVNLYLPTQNSSFYTAILSSHSHWALAKAAGHSVTGLQGSVEIAGIRGSRDAIIDGVLIDVKSANDRSMQKFRDNGLRDGDPFGYLSQLSSYLFASQDDDLLTEKNKAGFLVVDKNFGHIELHIYDLSDLMENKLQEVEREEAVGKGQENHHRKPLTLCQMVRVVI
jgi:hypothetical protein